MDLPKCGVIVERVKLGDSSSKGDWAEDRMARGGVTYWNDSPWLGSWRGRRQMRYLRRSGLFQQDGP